MQVSTASRRSFGSSTLRMPRPPPPATALTKSGYGMLGGRLDQRVDVGRRLHRREGRYAGRLGRRDRPGLVAGQRQHVGRRADEGDAGVGAGLGQGGVLGQEAVAGVDRVGARPHRRPRRSRRGRGRRAPGGRARRSRRPRRPSAGARTSGPRSGNTATVRAPSSYAARNARIAISPRLATSTLENMPGTLLRFGRTAAPPFQPPGVRRGTARPARVRRRARRRARRPRVRRSR